MQIAICDDEVEEREKLSVCVKEYFDKKMIVADMDIFSSGEALLTSYIPGKYDILFLDIYMLGLTGVDVARHIRSKNDDVEIFFITTSEEHFRDGYNLRILEYISKPITSERIVLAMDRLFRLFSKAKLYLEVMCDRNVIKIPYDAILWMEVYGHRTIIHTTTADYTTRSTFGQVVTKLPTPPFYKLNKSELLNFDQISGLEDNGIRLTNMALVAVDFSSRYGKNVRKIYHDYLFTKERGGIHERYI